MNSKHVMNTLNALDESFFYKGILYMTRRISQEISLQFFNGKEFAISSSGVCNHTLYIQKPENGKSIKFYIKQGKDVYEFLNVCEVNNSKWRVVTDTTERRVFRSVALEGYVVKFISVC
ncbi:hypothetical protein EIN_187130 [Entamoeba invadens IP1]|uniref:hypothetical protein n=1 Tax=Entamoeba invadens IP1 TaxID=370355 RepID=UPI0002C3E611|nr:hypothetical protein EIN_187130 [Entamoeba invadens IP1]ELP94256.1 hypothetical protein EIN_187130 [Entamoeba invadens IP1]|eukprot:XP_004261027.1 hypothetical protein EIN_187130 [Entamoeba invadens IP1]